MATLFSRDDLQALRALRATLIALEDRPVGERAPRYWGSRHDVSLYDRVFGARIGCKWEAVLDEIDARADLPAPRTILDWGAGTGVATRALLRRIEAPERVTLFDRDETALAYAADAVREAHPGIDVRTTSEPPPGPFDLALASHVLDELEDDEVDELLGAFRQADEVVWVEPGSRRTSRRLSAARDALIDEFDVVAPCTHRQACGMLAEGRERDWCHLFARPPAEVHTTAEWTQVGRELGIDLRSLPYAFLALRRAPVPHPDAARLLGRPRVQKGRALVDLCDADGVRGDQIPQRADRAFFKSLKDTRGTSILLRVDGRDVVRVL